MAAYHEDLFEPQFKRQKSADYGMNPLGILIANSSGCCNCCHQGLVPGQRIMLDSDYDSGYKRWSHFECALPRRFDGADADKCTVSATAHNCDGKKCAWCTQPILAGTHQWKGCWMGWVHAECNVAPLHDVVSTLTALRHKYPGHSLPYKSHWWLKFEDLCLLASSQSSSQSLSAGLLNTHLSLPAPAMLATPPVKPLRWSSIRDEPEADSDSEPELPPASASDQPGSPSMQSHSGSELQSSDSDEPLQYRANRRRGTHPFQSRQRRHRPGRHAAPADYRVIGIEAAMRPELARQRHQIIRRSRNLGDQDTASEGDEDCEVDSFIDDSDVEVFSDGEYVPPGRTQNADGDSESTSSSSNGIDQDDEEEDQDDVVIEETEIRITIRHLATQAYAPVLKIEEADIVDLVNPAAQEAICKTERPDTAAGIQHQKTQRFEAVTSPKLPGSVPCGVGGQGADPASAIVIDSDASSEDEPTLAAPITPAQVARLIAGRKRLHKRRLL